MKMFYIWGREEEERGEVKGTSSVFN